MYFFRLVSYRCGMDELDLFLIDSNTLWFNCELLLIVIGVSLYQC